MGSFNTLLGTALPYLIPGVVSGVILGSAPMLTGATQKVKKLLGISDCTDNVTEKYQEKHKNNDLWPAAYNRDDEAESVENQLASAHTSAILLYGPSGCGKTALFQEIVYRQITGKSSAFAGYQFLSMKRLDDPQTGALYAVKDTLLTNGEEGRFDGLFQQLRNQKIILFIDEVATKGVLNYFSRYLEILGEGETKIIMATTTAEFMPIYKKWDESMARRIKAEEIKEFTLAKMIEALEAGLDHYNKRYEVSIMKDALPYIAALSDLPINNSLSSQPLHFPAKTISLLEAICNAVKRNIHKTVTIEFALNYYAKIYKYDRAKLEREIKITLDEIHSIKQDVLFNQLIHSYLPSAPNFEQLPCLKDICSELNTIYCRQGNGAILLGRSSHVNQAIIDSLSSSFSYRIIKLNLSIIDTKLKEISKLKLDLFAEKFKQFCYDASNEKMIFYIEDGETLIELLEKATEDSQQFSESRTNQELLPSNVTLPIGNGKFDNAVNQSLKAVNQLASQLNLTGSTSQTGKASSRNTSGAYNTQKNKYCPFIKEFIDLIQEKKISFVSSFTRSKDIALIKNYTQLSYTQQPILPLNYEESLFFLKQKYPYLKDELLSTALFLSIFYFENPIKGASQPDMAIQLIEEAHLILKREQKKEEPLQGDSISSKDSNVITKTRENLACKFGLLAAIPQMEQASISKTMAENSTELELSHLKNAVLNLQRKLNLPSISSLKDIENKTKLAPLLNGSFIQSFPIHIEPKQQKLISNPEITALLTDLLAHKKPYYITEESAARRKHFYLELVSHIQEASQTAFKGDYIYYLDIKPLYESKLKKEICEKILHEEINKLNKKIQSESILIINTPFSLLTPETRELLKQLVENQNLYFFYLCQKSDIIPPQANPPLVSTEEAARETLKLFLPSAITSYVVPAASYLFNSHGAQTQEKKLSLCLAPLFSETSHLTQLGPLRQTEIHHSIQEEAQTYLEGSNLSITDRATTAFAKIYAFYGSNTSLDQVKTKFKEIFSNKCITTQNSSQITEDDVFEKLHQVFDKEIDEIKDVFDPTLTSFVSKTRRKTKSLINLSFWSFKQALSLGRYTFIIIPFIPALKWLIPKILTRFR